MKCVQHVSEINFIRDARSQKFEKPNKSKVVGNK